MDELLSVQTPGTMTAINHIIHAGVDLDGVRILYGLGSGTVTGGRCMKMKIACSEGIWYSV